MARDFPTARGKREDTAVLPEDNNSEPSVDVELVPEDEEDTNPTLRSGL